MTDETPMDDTDEHIPANVRARTSFNMDDLPDLRDNPAAGAGDARQPSRNQEEFTTVYDTIDAMERALNESKGTMFSPTLVKIDRVDFLDQLQALKAMLPVQLERASALMREAERRLEAAQSQANVIITSAQSRAADMIRDANDQVRFLTDQENITQLARDKATQILNKAQHTSDRLTQGADRYCIGVMNDLQEQLDKLKRDVGAGLQVLEDRQQKAAQDVPHVSDDDYPRS